MRLHQKERLGKATIRAETPISESVNAALKRWLVHGASTPVD